MASKSINPGEYIVAPKGDTWSNFKCPACGNITALAKKHHDVYYDGSVKPNVHCPHKPCNFNGAVLLEGWIPEAKGNA